MTHHPGRYSRLRLLVVIAASSLAVAGVAVASRSLAVAPEIDCPSCAGDLDMPGRLR